MAISKLLRRTAARATTSSGMEVPKAIMLAATTSLPSPSPVATATAPSTV